MEDDLAVDELGLIAFTDLRVEAIISEKDGWAKDLPTNVSYSARLTTCATFIIGTEKSWSLSVQEHLDLI